VATIVLLPGMDGTGQLFSDFISSLPASAGPLVISYPPDQPLGYEALEAFAKAKLPSHPFILVGESFSGPIAVSLAAALPATVRGLVLVGSFIRTPIPRWLGAALTVLPIWRIPIRLTAFIAFGQWSSDTLRARLSAAVSMVTPAVWRARLKALSSVDVGEKLRLVRAPVLYLRGKSDRMVTRSAWLLAKEILPSARLVELEGPHFVLQAKPVESAAQVTAFAREAGFAL
jgi:pimeloyl-ACP methyl ester carboxylesterase